jgi:cytochrome c oxidase subunit 2
LDLTHGIQSALNPQGPHAAAVSSLSWVMFAGGAAVLAIVMALAAYALWAPQERRAWAANRTFIIIGGVVFPLVVLTALLIYSLVLARSLVSAGPADVRIEIIAHQWWWRVNYLGPDGQVEFATANEIRIPAGRPVDLILKSEDVIHSFWVPNLAGKLDMIPGRVNRLRVSASREGVFRGQCAEYCGGPHAQMALYVIAHGDDGYATWRAAQQQPARDAADAPFARGRTLFLERCSACHTVRGTTAEGELGPDLTHVGSRMSIAAGILPNNVGTLAAWISSSQQIKPGNLMPSMNVYSGEELRAVAAYLAALD